MGCLFIRWSLFELQSWIRQGIFCFVEGRGVRSRPVLPAPASFFCVFEINLLIPGFMC